MADKAAVARLIILTGPIGAGKTTVAAELLREPQRPTAYIEGDQFWRFIAHPASEAHEDAFRIILRAMSDTAVTFARNGYEALLDFSMPLGYLDRAAALFRGVPVHVAVLRPSLATCIERSSSRKLGAIQYAQEQADFYELFRHVPDRYFVDGDAAPAPTLANEIRMRLEQGSLLYPNVDAGPSAAAPRAPRSSNEKL